MSQSESFVRSTLDSLDSHIAVVGETGEILSVNEAWRRFCATNGGAAGSACGVGVNYLRVCEGAASGRLRTRRRVRRRTARRSSRQSEGFALEYACHSPEARRWFVACVTPSRDGPHHVVIAHDDITHRILAEEALIAERSRLRTVLDTIPDLVWVKDPEGVFLSCNTAFARSMGRDEREIVGGRDADFCSPEAADSYRLHDLQAIALGGPWATRSGSGRATRPSPCASRPSRRRCWTPKGVSSECSASRAMSRRRASSPRRCARAKSTTGRSPRRPSTGSGRWIPRCATPSSARAWCSCSATLPRRCSGGRRSTSCRRERPNGCEPSTRSSPGSAPVRRPRERQPAQGRPPGRAGEQRCALFRADGRVPRLSRHGSRHHGAQAGRAPFGDPGGGQPGADRDVLARRGGAGSPGGDRHQ